MFPAAHSVLNSFKILELFLAGSCSRNISHQQAQDETVFECKLIGNDNHTP